MESNTKKQVIGLYGEMQLAMALHKSGWQVHRAYIDDGIDFVISKYWCPKCKKFSAQYIKYSRYNGKEKKTVTNLCEHCKTQELIIKSRYLQIKTSEGKPTTRKDGAMDFSFHPRICYCTGDDVFNIWIAVFDQPLAQAIYFYIFKAKDTAKFDNMNLPSYQITDNQQTHLFITDDGIVHNDSQYDYDIFNREFCNNWGALEID